MNTAFSCFEASFNPFALMVNRGRVLAAVYHSGQLNALASQVFRPLDKAHISGKDEGEAHGQTLPTGALSDGTRP